MSTPTPGTSTEDTGTREQTIGMVTISDPEIGTGEGGQLPIISTVFSMSAAGDIEGPEEEEAAELGYESTVMQELASYDPKEHLGSHDLRIKKELVDGDLQPGDPEYYSIIQNVYKNLLLVEKAVDA